MFTQQEPVPVPVPVPVPGGIFTSYPSSHPQFDSRMIVNFFSNNHSAVENDEALETAGIVDEPTPTVSPPEELVPPFSPVSNFIGPVNDDGSGNVENNESFETLGRVDEPIPTVSLPEEIVLPFSRFSNFIDHVNDDGSGYAKLVAEQNLEKTLLDYFKPQLKINQIVAAQLWFTSKIVKTTVLRSSLSKMRGSWTENQRFMLDVTEKYLTESSNRVYSCDRKSERSNSSGLIDTLIPYLSKTGDVTYLLNRQVSVSAFQLKCPQWAPNLHVYKSPPRNDSKPSKSKETYIICGTLAIPVFDHYTNQFVGVYEVVTASTEIDLAVVVKIGNLLKMVNLRADTQFHYQPRKKLLAEIMKVIIKVCEDHDLPLAQTWMPCTCPDQSCNSRQLCMSNAELPFYMRESFYYPFWSAGAMYHMAEGKAVAGTTYSSKGLCFCRDITLFPDNFALAALSREFKINCSLAVCLGSAYANNDVYILQFFWPRTLKNTKEDDDLKVFSVTTTMKQQFDKLKMLSPTYEVLEAETETVTYRTILIDGEGNGDDFTFSNIISVEEHNKVDTIQPEDIPSDMLIIDQEDHKPIDHGIEVVESKVTKQTRRKKCNLSKEDLEPYLKGTVTEAANKLRISKSTLKRKCRELKIENWQDERKRKGIGVPPRNKISAKRSLHNEMENA